MEEVEENIVQSILNDKKIDIPNDFKDLPALKEDKIRKKFKKEEENFLESTLATRSEDFKLRKKKTENYLKVLLICLKA